MTAGTTPGGAPADSFAGACSRCSRVTVAQCPSVSLSSVHQINHSLAVHPNATVNAQTTKPADTDPLRMRQSRQRCKRNPTQGRQTVTDCLCAQKRLVFWHILISHHPYRQHLLCSACAIALGASPHHLASRHGIEPTSNLKRQLTRPCDELQPP
jgi:hypothetical protein